MFDNGWLTAPIDFLLGGTSSFAKTSIISKAEGRNFLEVLPLAGGTMTGSITFDDGSSRPPAIGVSANDLTMRRNTGSGNMGQVSVNSDIVTLHAETLSNGNVVKSEVIVNPSSIQLDAPDTRNKSGLLAVDSTGKVFVFSGLLTSGNFNPDIESYGRTTDLDLAVAGNYTRNMTANDVGRTYKFWHSAITSSAAYALDYNNKGGIKKRLTIGCDVLVFLTCVSVSNNMGRFLRIVDGNIYT
jgi:hypothetical protein